MPSFHYEAERWGIQFVVDSKSFAERHSPLFRGSPVKTNPSQARGAARHPGVPPCQVWWRRGWRKREIWGEPFIPKDKASPNFYQKAQGNASKSQSTARKGRVLALRVLNWIRWISHVYPQEKSGVYFRLGLFISFLLHDLSLLEGNSWGNFGLILRRKRPGDGREGQPGCLKAPEEAGGG